jgi:hypothetical protein
VLRTSDNQSEYIYVVEFSAGIAENGWLPAYSYPNRLAAFGLFQYDITVNVYRPLEQILQIYDPVNDLRIQEKQFFHSSLTRGGTTYNTKFHHICGMMMLLCLKHGEVIRTSISTVMPRFCLSLLRLLRALRA